MHALDPKHTWVRTIGNQQKKVKKVKKVEKKVGVETQGRRF